MDIFTIISVLVFLSAIFGYINARFLKLPNSIGLMLITIVFTLAVFAIGYIDDTLINAERYIITQIDFKSVLLDIMLSFLLFAGALHTNFEQLKVQRWPILVFSTLLFVIRISYFANRSYCRFGNFKKGWCTKKVGNQNCGRIIVQ